MNSNEIEDLHNSLKRSNFFTDCKFDRPVVAKTLIHHNVIGNYDAPLVANKFGIIFQPHPQLIWIDLCEPFV